MVVADTTPLRHLVAIGKADLLASLYRCVSIGPVIQAELQASATPERVKKWIYGKPSWLDIRQEPDLGRSTLFAKYLLDPGERETLQMAVALQAELVLIDDRAGRNAAKECGLRISGTIGVFESAHDLGLLPNFLQVLSDIEASGFYLSSSFRSLILDRYQQRFRRLKLQATTEE
ncbi:MAG: hypothetical protein NW208_19290 [Bryobacter sp.]|nr:hypothetical protein [Bryobacter sp.]